MRSNVLTQGFGLANTKPFLLPIYNALGLKGHDGWDWSVRCQNNTAKTGGKCEPVYCGVSKELVITYIQEDINKGFGVVATTPDKEWKFLWWHLDSINPELKVGGKLETDTLIGIGGNTGQSTGAHLHFACYRYSEPHDNGYNGAISPEPYFVNIFAVDYINNLKAQVGVLTKIINLIKQFI